MKPSAVLLSVVVPMIMPMFATGCAKAGAATGDDDDTLIDAPGRRVDAAPRADAGSGLRDAATDAPAQTSGHLVINEVDYDQPGTDNAEFVEIYNPTAAAKSLTGVQLALVNGAANPDGTVYDYVDLSGETSLAAGGYLVVCGAGVAVAAGATRLNPNPSWGSNDVQNGPDGLALIDTTSHTVIDALSYGSGSITSVTFTGFAAPSTLVEGTPAVAIDSSSAPGSLCRSPNGQDTDDANSDWSFCPTISAGAANPVAP